MKIINLIKKILGISLNSEEQRILKVINQSGLTTMRVVGRGTLIVNVKEVTNTAKFKKYVKQAKNIVN